MVNRLILLTPRSETNRSRCFSNISDFAKKPTSNSVDYIYLKIKKKSKDKFCKMNSLLLKNKRWGLLLTLYCRNIMILCNI